MLFHLRAFFAHQVLDFPPFCAILSPGHGEPPDVWVALSL